MVFRRRRYRRPRRSKWRGRRRSWYRKYHRRHFWRRRRHFRRRTAPVRYYPSRRRKRISVRGWEPLGNICYKSSASAEATPYDDLDTTDYNIFNSTQGCDGLKGQWYGQWGHHFFTLQNLIRRSQYYFNYFSSDWQGYDYVSFKGGWIWLPRLPAISWMFYLDNSPQSNPQEPMPEAKYKYDKSWVHPGILLNRPGSKLLINVLQQPYRSLFRRIRVVPPPVWEGTYRIDAALQYLLFHWSWTTVNLSAPFFDYYCSRQGGDQAHRDTCIERPWFICCRDTWKQKMNDNSWDGRQQHIEVVKKLTDGSTDSRAAWVNRKFYIKSDCVNTPNAQSKFPSNFWNWGPFLPQNVLTGQAYEASVYFRYKLLFQFSGESLYRKPPSKECDGALYPPAPGESCNKISSHSIYKKRPLSTNDILPGDLDEDGLLTERAYQRITRPDRDIQSTGLECISNQHLPPRKRVRFRESSGVLRRKRARQLIRVLLGGRGESRGGGPPPNPPPIREPLDLLLNFPK
nr:ORF1 [Torque teno Leptonychotes weddellii virus 1]